MVGFGRLKEGIRDAIDYINEIRPLADTGVFVSELCLGTMTFGGTGQIWEVIGGLDQTAVDAHRRPRARCRDQLHRHRERLLAPANRRRLLGKAHRRPPPRDRAGDQSARTNGPGPNQVGLSRLHIIDSVEASLKRLSTDYIDLYQIHRSDTLTNIEDTLRALDDLVRAGKVRYIGCSNLPAWYLMKALATSREQRLERFSARSRTTRSPAAISSARRSRCCKDQGLGLLVWSPLAGGFLSGKFTRDGGDETARRAQVRLPAGGQGEGLRDPRRADADREGARRDGAANRAGVDSGERRGDQRHHRRAQASRSSTTT